jgi:hypothetical protein
VGLELRGGGKMDKPRRFRLRNGIIVEEWDKGEHFTNKNKDGYIDDYKIIDTNGIDSALGEDLIKDDWLCIGLPEHGYANGGIRGPDFDIIEEVPVV